MSGMFSSGKPTYKDVSPKWQQSLGTQLSGEFAGTSPATTQLGKLMAPANFDVANGQQWQGLQEQSKLAETNAQNMLKRQGAAGGWLYSDPYQRASGDTAATFAANRDATLGGLQTQEQQMQLSASEQLMQTLMGYKPDQVQQPGARSAFQQAIDPANVMGMLGINTSA
jgi:hypothetical protein